MGVLDSYCKALLIIGSIDNELALGTKHYSDGKLLTTKLEILEAMKAGTLVIEPSPERKHIFEDMVGGN